MTKALAEGIKKVRELPEEVQDRIGQELRDRAAAWQELREKILEGVRELDDGLGKPFTKKDLKAMIRKWHESKK